jgi:hypothetical protein
MVSTNVYCKLAYSAKFRLAGWRIDISDTASEFADREGETAAFSRALSKA